MKALRYIINLLLLIAIVFIGYSLVKTVEEPIAFEKAKEIRDDAVIGKLKKIRSAQLAHKEIYGKFTGSFDTLIQTIKTQNFDVVKQIGDPNDSTVVAQAVVTKKPIIDSLFDGKEELVDNLPYVPFSDGKEKFSIEQGAALKNGLTIPAFEVKTPYEVVYAGLVKKYYANKIGKSIKVGSLTEGTTTGNWEK